MEQVRQASVYGVRPVRTFEQAAARFVRGHQHKRSIDSDVGRLKGLMPVLGQQPLERIHMGVLEPWIDQQRKDGVSAGTINHGLKVVRRIVNLAATEWVDEFGLTWLAAAPKIRLLPDTEKRQPYPLSWDEQARLFGELTQHLAGMALFAVNSGCRDGIACRVTDPDRRHRDLPRLPVGAGSDTQALYATPELQDLRDLPEVTAVLGRVTLQVPARTCAWRQRLCRYLPAVGCPLPRPGTPHRRTAMTKRHRSRSVLRARA